MGKYRLRLVGKEILELMRRIVALLLLFALSLRALVPVGFMPGQAAASDGGLTLVICTSTGVVQLDKLNDEPGVPHAPGETASDACAFGVLSSDHAMPAPHLASLDVDAAGPSVTHLPNGLVDGAFLRQPNPARGPPHHLS